MTDTNTTPAPNPNVVSIAANTSDLDVLNWLQTMVPTIQQKTGRSDQLWIRLEWTPKQVLFTAQYPEDVAPEGEAPQEPAAGTESTTA